MWYKSLTILDGFSLKKKIKKIAFFLSDNLEKRIFALPLHRKTERKCSSSKLWEFSSAGLEHLPYKQRVGGSNPSTPTNEVARNCDLSFFISAGRYFRSFEVANYHSELNSYYSKKSRTKKIHSEVDLTPTRSGFVVVATL